MFHKITYVISAFLIVFSLTACGPSLSDIQDQAFHEVYDSVVRKDQMATVSELNLIHAGGNRYTGLVTIHDYRGDKTYAIEVFHNDGKLQWHIS